ncbi:06b48e63-40c0-40db-aa93-38a75701d0bd [Thermothielavioides terrestris]|uniref:06b48e63-40c0-40db-aa93-38a75701d0bd n=1 Tax=Thermothielavioides terrestris TaxID=2587410 RepID=A0A446B5Y9_9PEZI|nr:06b48e63-40c0-40db-aa93-38a75701d0bd [Thermothielavioides terrestris]
MTLDAQKPQKSQQDLLVNDSLLKKIDALRAKNIGKHLVVVGDQSSGKSSLLESLTGIPFPRDVELCTRYATQITQRRDDVSRVEVSIIPGPNASEAHKRHVEGYRSPALNPEDFRQQFPSILREVNERMGIRMRLSSNGSSDSSFLSAQFASDASSSEDDGQPVTRPQGGSVFSEDVLKIEICGPSVDYLTVIDVPGIFRMPTPGVTTKADMVLVRNMVRWYIQDSRTVILAVLPCNIDISNQEILTLAEEYDKNGERTLGILTKPDLVTEPSAQAAVRNIILGKKKQLRLGYYLVRSRGADMNDADFLHREDEFKKAAWASLPPPRVGVGALKRRLAELLGHMARREFPKLRKEIGEMLHSVQRERDSLGPSRKDEQEQRRFLSGVAQEFQELVRAGLEAQYAVSAAFEKSAELRLVTRVVNLADAFSDEFKRNSVLRRFDTIDEPVKVEASPSRATPDSDRSDSILEFARDIDTEDYPELENIISHDYDIEEPEDGILDWITDLYVRSRGMDLGTFSSAVWASAWTEQSSKWPAMSRAFMSKVIVAVHRFIMAALEVVCADPRVREELWSAMQDEVLRRYEAGMAAAEYLASAERDTKPYTLDRHFNEHRQRCRGGRIAGLLQHVTGHKDYQGLVSIRQVSNVTEQKPNIEDIVEKLHDDLSAYYDIACSRFVDNLLNQAVNYHLLFGPSTPLGVFSQEWVIGLKPDQLEAIAGESPSIKEHRERLAQKINDLTAAKEILRH